MILIGLGSNHGDSVSVVHAARNRLARFASGELCCSHLYETSPVDCPPGAESFINAVVAFQARSNVSPKGLLFALKGIEREFGRGHAFSRNAPRILDLDLLLFDDQQYDTPGFTLPHPRACKRRFVLQPTAEILPDLIWPGTGQTVTQLLLTLHNEEQVARIPADRLTPG